MNRFKDPLMICLRKNLETSLPSIHAQGDLTIRSEMNQDLENTMRVFSLRGTREPLTLFLLKFDFIFKKYNRSKLLIIIFMLFVFGMLFCTALVNGKREHILIYSFLGSN